MPPIHSFDAFARPGVRVLVLGSMPGKVSLEAQQYYAHPRNAFWRIATELFGWPEGLAYEERIGRLLAEGVALWDVMQSCERESSLDSDIVESSIVPNDFLALLREHPDIEHLFFNGAKAEEAFRRHVVPGLMELGRKVELTRLPSTSPANASMRFEQKLEHWRVLRTVLSR